MSAVFGRHRRLFGMLAWALFVARRAGAAKADTVKVNVDSAHLLKLPASVATIVIGNPLIADATLQNGGILVITGKGYGATNLLALDRNGRVLMSKTVQVLGPAAGPSGCRLQGHQARNLELRARMPAAHHARRRPGLFRGLARADHRPQRRGLGRRRRRRRRAPPSPR